MQCQDRCYESNSIRMQQKSVQIPHSKPNAGCICRTYKRLRKYPIILLTQVSVFVNGKELFGNIELTRLVILVTLRQFSPEIVFIELKYLVLVFEMNPFFLYDAPWRNRSIYLGVNLIIHFKLYYFWVIHKLLLLFCIPLFFFVFIVFYLRILCLLFLKLFENLFDFVVFNFNLSKFGQQRRIFRNRFFNWLN